MSKYLARRDPGDDSRILVYRGRVASVAVVMSLAGYPSAEDLRDRVTKTENQLLGLRAALELVEQEEASESRRVARLASTAYEDAKNAGATPEDAMARSLAAVDADRKCRGEAVR